MILGYVDAENEDLRTLERKQNKTLSERKSVHDLAKKEGAGMAFITFPSVLHQFGSYPGPNILSFLFFFMLVVLAGNLLTEIINYCYDFMIHTLLTYSWFW